MQASAGTTHISTYVYDYSDKGKGKGGDCDNGKVISRDGAVTREKVPFD